MCHRLDIRWDFEAAQIGTTKDVASIRWRRDETDMNRDGCVQSYTASFDGTAEGGLFDQMSGPLFRVLLMFANW